MDEQELPPIQITSEDISEANQLSLHCPICAGPVERNLEDAALTPIVCAECGTLYHRACWEQNGGKCAILGCGTSKYIVYGQDTRPALRISYDDLQRPSANGRHPNRQTKRLKDQQRREVEQLRRPGLLRRLFQWLLDQIRVG